MPAGWSRSPEMDEGQRPREQRGLLWEEPCCRDGGGDGSATAEERKELVKQGIKIPAFLVFLC